MLKRPIFSTLCLWGVGDDVQLTIRVGGLTTFIDLTAEEAFALAEKLQLSAAEAQSFDVSYRAYADSHLEEFHKEETVDDDTLEIVLTIDEMADEAGGR